MLETERTATGRFPRGHRKLSPAKQASAEGAAAGRQPREPAGTCKSSELEAGAGEENTEALGLVPPPPAAGEAGHQPRKPAETCK
jgi:hypothetical protein